MQAGILQACFSPLRLAHYAAECLNQVANVMLVLQHI